MASLDADVCYPKPLHVGSADRLIRRALIAQENYDCFLVVKDNYLPDQMTVLTLSGQHRNLHLQGVKLLYKLMMSFPTCECIPLGLQ